MVNKFLHPAGGAETYMLEVGRFLERDGHSVQYFGMENPDNVVGNSWGLYASAMDFHRGGIGTGVRNPLSLISSDEVERKMDRLLEKFQPDVLHLNNFNYQLTPSVILAADKYRRKHAGALRIVYTAHDPQLICPNHYLYRPQTGEVCEECLDRRYYHCLAGRCIHGSFLRSFLGTLESWYWHRKEIYAKLDVILCPSAFLKDKLDRNPLLAGKTAVLRNFVRPVAGDGTEKRSYVLYFGRYSREKGIRTLLEVCRKLPDIPFVFAGSGPLEAEIKGVPNVRNFGFLNPEQLDAAVAGARFSVCPSECNENCPFSVMESIRNGIPVLGSDRGGIPELIDEGQTGWLFPAGNVGYLTEKIRNIWNSDDPENFSAHCREVHFDSLEEYMEKLLVIYRQGRKGQIVFG